MQFVTTSNVNSRGPCEQLLGTKRQSRMLQVHRRVGNFLRGRAVNKNTDSFGFESFHVYCLGLSCVSAVNMN